MRAVTFLVKPVSGLCQMRCRYCFYGDVSENRARRDMGRMDMDTAQALIRAGYDYAGQDGRVHFLFQGGEPALAGLDFFREFIGLAQALRPEGANVSFAIQTNGLALDRAYARFFRENGFMVGLSLDGTRALHDRFRRDAAGQGTWERTVRALGLLEDAGAETNLVCVLTGDAARAPGEIWRAMRRLGDHPLQFIPCLDPLGAPRGAMPWSLTPEAYGGFLRGLFDCWYDQLAAGVYVSVRFFDDLLRIMAGMPPGSCAAAGRCGGYLAVEADGGLYPCDFYVLDQWRIGGIRDMTVREALASPVMERFLAEGARRPAPCAGCPYMPLCRGGCRRDFTDGPAGPENYHCRAMKLFFPYALPRLQAAARVLFRPGGLSR